MATYGGQFTLTIIYEREFVKRKLKDEGLSFSKLILEERMMMAQRLLIYSNHTVGKVGNDSNLLIVFYVQIMPDDFVMQLHRF